VFYLGTLYIDWVSVGNTYTELGYFVGRAEDYQIPYYDQVSNDPSFEEMKSVVYDRNIRPHISNKWHSDDVSSYYLPY